MFPYFIGGTWTYNYSEQNTMSSFAGEMGAYTERVVMIENGSGDRVRIVQVERTGKVHELFSDRAVHHTRCHHPVGVPRRGCGGGRVSPSSGHNRMARRTGEV